MRTLAAGLGLVESPRWHDGRLWFSDWIAGRIYAMDDDGRLELIVSHQSLPLCFDFLPSGEAILVSSSRRALFRLGDDGSLLDYADLSGVSPFGANDIVIDGRGYAFVNGANYDPTRGPAPSGDLAPGLIAVVPPGGSSARTVADDLAFPNGMAITADGRTLVVAQSHRQCLTAFDIGPDGTLTNRRTWAELGEDAPDGICIDADGAVWYADVPHRHCVRVREGGEVEQVIELDRGAFACMLGGADGRTLYIVAAHWGGMAAIAQDFNWDGQVLAESVSAPGAGWPARTAGAT